jgi:hypothetical protein
MLISTKSIDIKDKFAVNKFPETMKKRFLLTLTAIILLSLTGISHLNAQFKVDAMYRPRFELRDGYQKLAAKGSVPAGFISQRSRINFSYESENFKLKFTPQDVRIWGDEEIVSMSGVSGDSAALDVFEAYAEVRLGELGWVSVGRQQLSYDNEWMLAFGNWGQAGNASDAVVFKLKPLGWNLHLGSVWNTKTEASSDNLYPTSRYKTLNFLWLNKAITEKWNLSILQMANGLTQTDSTNNLNFRYTTGFYTQYKPGNINVTANAYYQYGKSQTALPVSAYLLALDASYKAGKFTPGIGLSYHSGNSKTGASLKTDNLFDLVYSSRHSFFGYMDYFKTFSSNTKQGGLQDYYLYLDYKISKSVSVKDFVHSFSLAQTNPTTPADKKLGYENDLVLKYKFSDWGALESGYMFFLPTKGLETIQKVTDSKFSQFFYLQLILTPVLFKQAAAQ